MIDVLFFLVQLAIHQTCVVTAEIDHHAAIQLYGKEIKFRILTIPKYSDTNKSDFTLPLKWHFTHIITVTTGIVINNMFDKDTVA